METKTVCPGCGAALLEMDGPVHAYMTSSPACFNIFTRILASEYSDPSLLPTHRLSVDTYAVQHPGSEKTRQQIQSVGLHLARLSLQTRRLSSPRAANDVMLGLGQHKSTLRYLEPPKAFSMTICDIEPYIGSDKHASKIKEWAMQTWSDWSDHHDYIHSWVAKHLAKSR